ncbi:MAG: DUF1847 domain-containing protein [Clostridiales bacterium]
MNCINCKTKSCKIEYKDCNLNKENVLAEYSNKEIHGLYKTADNLVSNGKAGELSRIEELIEFINENNYNLVSIAYCFSMENQVKFLSDIFKENNIKTTSIRCTINGIKENEILSNNKENVNCNPIGQAKAINNSSADFVIEMGLCLGHDVLFHKYIKKPFTVLAVKDRVYNNCPLKYFVKENLKK